MKEKVALIDWDGTIRKGFTIKEWIKFLVTKLNRNDKSIIRSINALFLDYWNGKISHDHGFKATGTVIPSCHQRGAHKGHRGNEGYLR